MKSFLQPLCVQDESEMINLCKAGDEQARDILIERNLRLVAHIVKKYTSGEKAHTLKKHCGFLLKKAVNGLIG